MGAGESKPFIVGVDYYPEHWPEAMMDDDLSDIAGMGATTVRIGEFAWHAMEPTPGDYDFSFFDRVIERAKAKGLNVIFGTPTATFPAWLAATHPEILAMDQQGNRHSFGGRRQYCYNSPVYRKAALNITERLVQHYGSEEGIIAWQVDNEFGHEGSDMCYCPICIEKFRRYLETKYKNINGLNEDWGTIFWGQTYNSFDEIPGPLPTITTHNPSLQLEWARFRSESLLDFAKTMIDGIRRHKGGKQLVTHNLFGGYFNRCYDQDKLSEWLDVVSFDNYPVWGGLEEPISPSRSAMALDYIRGLKKQNFWVLEQLIGAQGHQEIGYIPRPRQAVMWAFQAMARGCDGLLFFRWRGMTRGAEQFCLGILDQDNRKGRKFAEAKEFFETAASHQAAFKAPIKADICAIYDFDTIWSWHFQPQSGGFDFETEFNRVYTPFYMQNRMIDVRNSRHDFSDYAVVLAPAMQIVDQPLTDRLERYVAEGGILVLTFRTGIKDRCNNLHFLQTPPGLLSNLSGIEVCEGESLGASRWAPVEGCGHYEGCTGKFSVWRDFITPVSAETLFRYSDSFYNGYAAVTRNRYKNGWVYTVGGGADPETLRLVAEEIAGRTTAPPSAQQLGVEIVRRESADGTTTLVLNHTAEEQTALGHAVGPYGCHIEKSS